MKKRKSKLQKKHLETEMLFLCEISLNKRSETFYSEKSILNKREDARYLISFNKDDFIDAILEANVFETFVSITEYVDEYKAEIPNFLIKNGDNLSASVLAYAFCYKEETIKHKSQEIIQRLLDNKNTHHSYTQIFFWAENNFVSDEQKWKWIEQYLGFSKDNSFFQRYCVMWLKTVFESDKHSLLIRLNKLNDLGATFHNVINAILKATEGKEKINKARELLRTNKDPQVICKYLPILKETSEGKDYALNILNDWKNKYNNLVIRSLEVLAGINEAEEITKDIIRNHLGKFNIYSRMMFWGHGNYDCWQKEVKRVIKNWWKNSELVVGHCLRHSEDNYFETETVCLGYLEEWKERIKKVKGKQKPIFYFMTKSLAHPYLRKEEKETAGEMLEYEKNNKGFLPDVVKQVSEDIKERNIFPEWHTKVDNIEIDE